MIRSKKIFDKTQQKIVEKKWKKLLQKNEVVKPTMYILSMFPYPSGALHMGHARVYSTSDAICRFYGLIGEKVFHPIGWDAFGLPAENAARQNDMQPNKWIEHNIGIMREQLEALGINFAWKQEFSTTDPKYYKFTQQLFLMLFKRNLIFKGFAEVNWDPVDQTVLADEQVDDDGYSWRSGAKVERVVKKQWFIRTRALSQELMDGLENIGCFSQLFDDNNSWKIVVAKQKEWIGKVEGYFIDFQLKNDELRFEVFVEDFLELFVGENRTNKIFIPKTHLIYRNYSNTDDNKNLSAFLMIDGKIIYNYEFQIEFKDEKEIDSYRNLCRMKRNLKNKTIFPDNLKKDLELNFKKTSSKLRDWCISRQRKWGTPIPIINCRNCGSICLKEEDLPLKIEDIGSERQCSECGGDGQIETDTMDTFMDSSWYYLYYSYQNEMKDKRIFDELPKLFPIDLYLGGLEHAITHLFTSRFITYFLQQEHQLKNNIPNRQMRFIEPFKRFLPIGMIKGSTMKLKSTGQYVPLSECVEKEKDKYFWKGKEVSESFEKMSKSKFNGINPIKIIEDHGIDLTRFLTLSFVAPKSDRNFSLDQMKSCETFLLNLQNSFLNLKNDFEQFHKIKEHHLIKEDLWNNYIKFENHRFDTIRYVTHQMKHTMNLAAAIVAIQQFYLKTFRKISKHFNEYPLLSIQYYFDILLMLHPFLPSFTSEYWYQLYHLLKKNDNPLHNKRFQLNYENSIKNELYDNSIDVFKFHSMDLFQTELDYERMIKNYSENLVENSYPYIHTWTPIPITFMINNQQRMLGNLKDKGCRTYLPTFALAQLTPWEVTKLVYEKFPHFQKYFDNDESLILPTTLPSIINVKQKHFYQNNQATINSLSDKVKIKYFPSYEYQIRLKK
ncbi:hypothetical protein SNEBB_000115 [Seison nebaliae]|nr:hypothetical protein SNEBB_000115 [Seison nebaliae]